MGTCCHADGNTKFMRVAAREAFEENGLSLLWFLQVPQSRHPSGSSGASGNQLHHDIRYGDVAESGESMQSDGDGTCVRWVSSDVTGPEGA